MLHLAHVLIKSLSFSSSSSGVAQRRRRVPFQLQPRRHMQQNAATMATTATAAWKQKGGIVETATAAAVAERQKLKVIAVRSSALACKSAHHCWWHITPAPPNHQPTHPTAPPVSPHPQYTQAIHLKWMRFAVGTSPSCSLCWLFMDFQWKHGTVFGQC